MAKKIQQQIPLSDIDRDQLVRKCIEAAEPMTAAEVAKANVATRKVTAAEVTSLLEESIATGRMYIWPAKSAKGQPRYWGQDALSVVHDAVLNASRELEAPLTAKDLLKKLKIPIKLTEDGLIPTLDQLIRASWIHQIPAATKKGKPRYWNHDSTEFARRAIKQRLTENGSQSESVLKKALNWLNAQDFQQLLESLIQSGTIRRYPKLGKNEMFGVQPPRAYPYLQEVQSQLSKIVASLIAAGVPQSELRRAAVQMFEQAGITFGEASESKSTVDLISVMKQIEPGAANGALVGARDLRRAMNLEKAEFDLMVLDLSRHGRLSLHRHDYPSSLSQQERDELVTDGAGTYFVGIALRQNS